MRTLKLQLLSLGRSPSQNYLGPQCEKPWAAEAPPGVLLGELIQRSSNSLASFPRAPLCIRPICFIVFCFYFASVADHYWFNVRSSAFEIRI